MASIKAVIFDVDGVVFNSIDQNGYYYWSKNIKKDLGITGAHFKLIYSPAWDDVTSGKTETQKHLETVFKDPLFKDIQMTFEKYIDYWLENDQMINSEMIDFIKIINIPVYLGTNQDKHRTQHILDLVGHLFCGCFASYKIGYIKPNKEFFEFIEKTLELTPNELLLIDDTPANIDGARNQGWQTFLYKNNLSDLKVVLKDFT